MTTRRSLPIEQYQIGVVCALRHEMTAAIAILDERHQAITSQDKLDPNNYILGQVHEHNVVVACLPVGVYGTNAAARVANDMLRTFTGLRFGLMVGIGGGIPNLQKDLDIRLGDVVISQPDRTFGGVVQYDFIKNLGGEQFERIGFLKPPPTILLAALSTLQAEHDLDDSKVPEILVDMVTKYPNLEKKGYGFPGWENDTLYCPQCSGSSPSGSCDWCTDGKIERPAREDHNPSFWYGVIASGNELMKNAAERDRMGQEFGALCLDMEAAGLMNDFPCIVIRGICDYADSHKNDAWQKYAALVAAAYSKEFLGYISPEQTRLEKPIQDIVASLDNYLAKQSSLVAEHLHEVKREYGKQEQRYQNDQHRQCHRAFKTSIYEQFKDVNPGRVEDTCQWVLSHPQYLQWYTHASDDLLWISADPGCGKSVLAKALVDNELRPTDEHTICYFFFKDNEEQYSLITALCALLHQLFSQKPRLIHHAIPAWKTTGEKLVKEVAELWRILLAATSDDQAHNVTCVLDALDECRQSDRRLLIDMLVKFYTQTSPSQSRTQKGRLKFLVTSRPYDDIQAEFQQIPDNLPTIRLRGEEENDQIHQEIDLVIRMRVAKLAADLRLDSHTKDRLERKLLEMEHRTYLWLYLAIEGIYKTYQNSLRPEEALIKSLPVNVEDAYEKILDRASGQRSNVERILQIVVGARRPLTVQEMAIALGIATSTYATSLQQVRLDPVRLEHNIRDWCGLFIYINHARIYLIHQTAKEFLIRDKNCTTLPSGWKHCLDPQGTEKEMTRICVEYLCLEDVWPMAESLIPQLREYERLDDLLEKDNHIQSLLIYSAEHWPSHLREANLSQDDSAAFRILRFYQVESRLYNLWFSIFWQVMRPYEDLPEMSSIRLGGLLGHENILESMLRQKTDYDIDESDSHGRTALHWACTYGHKKVVQMLLDKEADINAQGGNDGNALQVASARGHEKVVQILLGREADVNAQGGHYGNALHAALAGGYEKVVQMLLDKEADVNAQGGDKDSRHSTALQAASAKGHEKVVQMLLDKEADVNAQGGLYGNALHAASAGGHEKVVQMLLDREADVNAQGGGGYSNALYAASVGGHEKVVQILLGREADVNAQGGEYGNALHAASAEGHEKVVQMLLDREADVNAQGGHYGNALQAASAGGHEKVVQMLLGREADVNAQGGAYGNALQAASVEGHEKVVQILLDREADVNAQGGHYGNALQAASVGGYEKVVQMLFDREVDVNAQGGVYGNALQAASAGGHEKVVQMLLNKEADVNAQGGHYGNALQAASAGGHEKVVQMLLDKEADLNARGGKRVLQCATGGISKRSRASGSAAG